MRALQFATAILASISFGLLLAALASDDWVTGVAHTGLWQACSGYICQVYGMNVQDTESLVVLDGINSQQLSLKEFSGYIHATRFFLMVGTFAGATSFLCLWVFICNFSVGSFSMAKIAGITSLVAGFCALVAMSILH
uniref:Uncharacterized protein n=1 Tax=Sphaerodactylus townsendi TaxID=933632 RepID=A0ACB8FSQ5_9SAUR